MKPSPKPSQKLPIDHPQFEYPHSRNPYAEKIKELSRQSKAFADLDCEKNSGQWRLVFQTSPSLERKPLIVEIGCNAGHVLVEWAQKNPEKLYFGIDWKYKPIFRASEKSDRKKLKNTLFARLHAIRLPYVFGPSEIDELYVLFPDPWPKKSQRKNRLIQAPWLKSIAPLVRPGGLIHIRTDHANYFETIQEAFELANAEKIIWNIIKKTDNLYAHHPNPDSLKIPEVTLFERLFLNDRLPIHQVIATRTED